jgi:ABC-2 type transport system permease protein
MNDFNVTRLIVDEEIERNVRPVVDKYEIQLQRQQSVVNCFRFLSPVIIAQDALNDIAGADSARHRHFVSLVQDFHTRWRKFFLPLIVQKAKLTAADYDTMPSFDYRDEPLATVAGRTGFGLIVLLLAAAVLGVMGYKRLNVYSVA